MDFRQLTALIQKGYTEDQIKDIYAIMGNAANGTPDTSPNTPPVTAPNTPPTNPPAPAPTAPNDATASTPPAGPNTDANNAVNTSTTNTQNESETQRMVAEILGLMQKGFINNLSTNQQAQNPDQTTEQILAQIMNP